MQPVAADNFGIIFCDKNIGSRIALAEGKFSLCREHIDEIKVMKWIYLTGCTKWDIIILK